jgi:hypothetical protein
VRVARDLPNILMRFNELGYYGVASSYELFVSEIPSLVAVEKVVSHLVEATRYLSEVAFFMDVAPFPISIAVDIVPHQSIHSTFVLMIMVQGLQVPAADLLLLTISFYLSTLTSSVAVPGVIECFPLGTANPTRDTTFLSVAPGWCSGAIRALIHVLLPFSLLSLVQFVDRHHRGSNVCRQRIPLRMRKAESSTLAELQAVVPA